MERDLRKSMNRSPFCEKRDTTAARLFDSRETLFLTNKTFIRKEK
jgi:hypothetical protein